MESDKPLSSLDDTWDEDLPLVHLRAKGDYAKGNYVFFLFLYITVANISGKIDRWFESEHECFLCFFTNTMNNTQIFDHL